MRIGKKKRGLSERPKAGAVGNETHNRGAVSLCGCVWVVGGGKKRMGRGRRSVTAPFEDAAGAGAGVDVDDGVRDLSFWDHGGA